MLMSETYCYYTVKPKLLADAVSSCKLHDSYNRVINGFSFVIETNGETKSITVHRGFLTNGNSIPALAKDIIDTILPSTSPIYVLYDWLSEYKLISIGCIQRRLSKKEFISILAMALKLEGLTDNQYFIILTLFKLISLLGTHTNYSLDPYKRYLEDNNFLRTD